MIVKTLDLYDNFINKLRDGLRNYLINKGQEVMD